MPLRPDRFSIALRSAEHAAWRERGLIDAIGGQFRLPLTVFEVDADGRARDRSGAWWRERRATRAATDSEEAMEITIIGTGNMARGLASCAIAGGHTVTLLGTEASKAEALAEDLPGEVGAGTVGGPLAGDVVVLAVWFQVVDDVLGRYGDQLDGKIIVDITNPIDPATFQRLALDAGSAAQEIARKAPAARVVKAFNTTFAGTLVAGEVAGQPLDVLLASDDEDAKAVISQVVSDGGLRPVDAGPLARAAELEALGYLHMAVQDGLGTGYGSAIKIIG